MTTLDLDLIGCVVAADGSRPVRYSNRRAFADLLEGAVNQNADLTQVSALGAAALQPLSALENPGR